MPRLRPNSPPVASRRPSSTATQSLACLFFLATALCRGAAESPAVPAPDPKAAAEHPAHEAQPAPAKADPAADKFWQGLELLKSKVPAERTAGLAALQASADLEFTHAQVALGNCYLSGFDGRPKDARKAANLFRLAAERGNAFAMVSLGVCYATGEGVKKDETKAMDWLNAALAPGANFSSPTPPVEMIQAQLRANSDAAVAGTLEVDPVSERQATAHYVLGVLYNQRKKLPEAQGHFVAAATAGPNGRSGIYAAAVAAAVNYAFGQGVPRDMAKANDMLEQSRKVQTRLGVTLVQNSVATKFTDSFAAGELEDRLKDAGVGYESTLQLGIAQMLADKKSKSYDVVEAAKWYEVAAENGQVWAMLPLAFIYCQGDLGHPDLAKAFYWFEKAGSGDTPKHYLATANLAICYQNGLGTEKDPEKAAALFKKWRNIDIVCYLGTIGQCPPAPLTYEQVLALNETWAKKKDPQAQFLLGRRYRLGWGVKVDADEAKQWFKKAAKTGHGDALNELGEMAEFQVFINNVPISSQKTMEEGLPYYRKSSDAGSPSGMANYARLLLVGVANKKDVTQAEALYRKCVQLDPTNATAHYALATIAEANLRFALLTNDKSAATNRAAMLEHFEAAEKLGHPQAASNLGLIYYEGRLVKQNFRKAYACFDDAAAHGSAAAHYVLGLMHEQGQGVPVTYTEAAYHYRLAALDGNSDALRRLINFYLTGQGVSLDLDQAAFWLLRMQEMTHSQHVFTTYCDVLLKKQAYESALPLLNDLKKSSDSKVAGFAYDRLATCYADGLGVKADPVQAKRYSDLAVLFGDGDALTKLAQRQLKEGNLPQALDNLRSAAATSRLANYQLGVMYYNGEQVPKNEAEGVKYLEAAAQANLTRALVFLANLTFHHATAAPSLDLAIQYAQRAESNGNAEAGNLREALEKRRREAETGADDTVPGRTP